MKKMVRFFAQNAVLTIIAIIALVSVAKAATDLYFTATSAPSSWSSTQTEYAKNRADFTSSADQITFGAGSDTIDFGTETSTTETIKFNDYASLTLTGGTPSVMEAKNLNTVRMRSTDSTNSYDNFVAVDATAGVKLSTKTGDIEIVLGQ